MVSDGAPGMIRAIGCLPRTARQRCLVHKVRNLQSKGAKESDAIAERKVVALMREEPRLHATINP